MNKQSYHQRILDAPYPDVDYRNRGEELAYIVGCNAMRDVATELASEADNTISELRSLIADVLKAFPDLAEYEGGDGQSLSPLANRLRNALASLPAAELQP